VRHSSAVVASVAAPDREYSEREVRGNHRKPPHLLVVGAGNSFDPGPARHMQEAKRGAQWRLQSPIGKEIDRVLQPPLQVFF